jgi:hypothetical protein
MLLNDMIETPAEPVSGAGLIRTDAQVSAARPAQQMPPAMAAGEGATVSPTPTCAPPLSDLSAAGQHHRGSRRTAARSGPNIETPHAAASGAGQKWQDAHIRSARPAPHTARKAVADDGHCRCVAHGEYAIVSPDFVALCMADFQGNTGDEGAGLSGCVAHTRYARPTNSEAGPCRGAHLERIASPEGKAQIQGDSDTLMTPDLRFADPLIAEIVALWRRRQGLTRAKVRLELQAQAGIRFLCEGDKAEAAKLVKLADNDSDDPKAQIAADLMAPYRMAQEPLERSLSALDRQLTKLAKGLPIWPYASSSRGLGALALAKIVGEAGDLSKYRTVSAVWKRCGLAVIDGQRQRKVANAEAAMVHGYSPERRSVLYVVAECLFKSQGTGDNSGPYRLIYDASKAKHLAKEGIAPIVAHKRALREMTKEMLKRLAVEWRRLDREYQE